MEQAQFCSWVTGVTPHPTQGWTFLIPQVTHCKMMMILVPEFILVVSGGNQPLLSDILEKGICWKDTGGKAE